MLLELILKSLINRSWPTRPAWESLNPCCIDLSKPLYEGARTFSEGSWVCVNITLRLKITCCLASLTSLLLFNWSSSLKSCFCSSWVNLRYCCSPVVGSRPTDYTMSRRSFIMSSKNIFQCLYFELPILSNVKSYEVDPSAPSSNDEAPLAYCESMPFSSWPID